MNWIAELNDLSIVAEQEKNISEHIKCDATKPTKLKIINPQIKPCPLCEGRDFVNGKQGRYFCKNCQPGIKGTPVKAGGERLKPNIKGNTPGIVSLSR